MEKSKRNVTRLFRMTKEEDAQLQKGAYAHDMNISQYLRWLIKKEHKKGKK